MKILFVCLVIVAVVGCERSNRPRYRRSIEDVRSLANGQSPTNITSADVTYFNWAECPDGSPFFNGNCYRWSGENKKKNWFASEIQCRAEGGNLVSILSNEESRFLEAVTSCSNTYWIGLVKTNNGYREPSNWSWFDRRNEHRYTRLDADNYYGHDCVYASSYGSWKNSYCSLNNFPYVCKIPYRWLTDETVAADSSKDKLKPAWWYYTTEATTETAYTTDTEYTREDITAATRSPSICPENWVFYDNHCYFFSKTSVNYFHAHLYCYDVQAHVVTIKSAQEQAFVQAMSGCERKFWIGLERAAPCLTDKWSSECWEWADLSRVNYENWRYGRPTPSWYRTTASPNECAFSQQAYWENTPCHTQMQFVCKRAVR